MKNKFVPLEGAPTHLGRVQAEALAALPLKGKRRPYAHAEKKAVMMHGPVGAGKSTLAWDLYNRLPQHARENTVYVSADEHGAMDSIADYRASIAAAPDAAARHAAWKHWQDDANYIRSRTLDMAIDRGLSLFIDTTGAGDKGIATMETLAAAGYHVTLVSCWAPLAVCVERAMGRERQADPEYLLSRRLGAFSSFGRLYQMADVVDIYYSSAADLTPGKVLSVTRTNLVQTPIKVTTNHPRLLGWMVEAMRHEGDESALGRLAGLAAPTDIQRQDLSQYGFLLSEYLRRTAGRLLPGNGPRPVVPSGL